jgi:hypothetical protein
MVCDICNAAGQGTHVSSDEMRYAVNNRGFDPFSLRLADSATVVGTSAESKRQQFASWKAVMVAGDTTGWNVCERCMSKLRGYLRGGATPNDRTAQGEAWKKYEQYITVPTNIPLTQVQANMRFQFMFATNVDAERIMSSLPAKYIVALRVANCWYRGPGHEGKYQIAWDHVRLTVPEGKELMNCVVSAGGGFTRHSLPDGSPALTASTRNGRSSCPGKWCRHRIQADVDDEGGRTGTPKAPG